MVQYYLKHRYCVSLHRSCFPYYWIWQQVRYQLIYQVFFLKYDQHVKYFFRYARLSLFKSRVHFHLQLPLTPILNRFENYEWIPPHRFRMFSFSCSQHGRSCCPGFKFGFIISMAVRILWSKINSAGARNSGMSKEISPASSLMFPIHFSFYSLNIWKLELSFQLAHLMQYSVVLFVFVVFHSAEKISQNENW